jgi:DNA invertase Pin-like site-specific DNA recombinase
MCNELQENHQMTGLEKLCSLVMNGSGKRRKQRKQNNQFVLYYRVSTKQQEESGLGLEAQKATAEAYVKQNGGTIVGTFIEVESGKDSTRKEIYNAIALANKTWSTLLIAKLDRLSRNVFFTSLLMESQVKFIACDSPQASRLTIHILAAVAESETEMIASRTRESLAAFKKRGGLLGPKTFKNPEEWKPKQEKSRQLATLKNALVAHAANEETRIIAKSLRANFLSFQAIANELNRLDHRTRTGKAWNKSQVKRLMDRANNLPPENVSLAQS